MAVSLQALLGIELPVIQAPLAGVQDSALAIAVSNAGGLGSLPAAMLGEEALRAELSALAAQTRAPYNVNFFCHTPPAADAAREARWREVLAPYYAEFGINAQAFAPGPARRPFSAAAAEVLAAFRPAVVSFHFGLPAPELLAQVRAWGAKILATATTVDEARWLAARGVDAVIAQGREAGGHRGHFLCADPALLVTDPAPLPTLELVAQLVAAIELPVIAAGGIADAAGVRAALARGAAGVQVGTAYLLCPEATTSAVHRAALQSAAAQDTAFTTLFSGRPARGIVNRLMRELGPLHPAAPAFPLAATAIGPLRAQAERLGRGDFSPLWAGESARACRELPAGALTRALAGLVP